MQNPEWKQSFTFDVRESDNYLNVCVWVKLDEERGNLLIGHVCTCVLRPGKGYVNLMFPTGDLIACRYCS